MAPEIPASAARDGSSTPAVSRAEYCQQLREWLWRVQHVQTAQALFPLWLLHQQTSATVNNSGSSSTGNNTSQQQQSQQQRRQGTEYHVPSVWKRFLAELIDFTLLVFVKIALIMVLHFYFDFFDLSKLDVDDLVRMVGDWDVLFDYIIHIDPPIELFLLEMTSRFMVFWFEVFFLMRGNRGDGGCTPGKFLLGLRVVRCDWTVSTLDQHVVVWTNDDLDAANGAARPRRTANSNVDLGFRRSMARSFCKNASLQACVPASLGAVWMEHGRTLYDLIAGSIVVEPPRR